MTGWICHTRKILSTVISSLADDLEQTVQDLNDAMHKLNSASANGSSRTDQPDVGLLINREPVGEHMVRSNTEVTTLLAKDQSFVPTEQYIVGGATTRQPETCGFSSPINSRRSRSSPSLTYPADDLIRAKELEFTLSQTSVSIGHSFASKSSSHSSFSASSPCLTHATSTRLTKSAEETVSDIYDIPPVRIEHQLLSTASLRHVQPTHSHHVCPCHGRDALNKATHIIGAKRPGKVVRTYPLSVEGRVTTCSQVIQQESTKGPSDIGPDLDENGKHCKDHEDLNTALVIVDRERHFIRWATLWPLSRVLSLAFSQLTNLVHLLIEDHQNIQSFASKDLPSVEPPSPSPKLDESTHSLPRSLSRECGSSLVEHGVSQATFHSRTSSSESFVILDASCFNYAPKENTLIENKVKDHKHIPHPGTDSCINPESQFYELCDNWIDSQNRSIVSNHVSEIISSSAEFVSFDFRKLITHQHFDTLALANHQSVKSGQFVGDMEKSWDVIDGESSTDKFRVMGLDSNGVQESDIYTECSDEKEHEDDGDSSVSFVILSDIDDDDDDEFIRFS